MTTNLVLDWVEHRFQDKDLKEATLNIKGHENEITEAIDELSKKGFKTEVSGNYLKVSK